MFEAKKPLSKPLPCNQRWEDMLPADGGRICKGCGKLVVDFRNYRWYEIEQAQRESIVPMCGIYDNEQLNNWGKDFSPTAGGSSGLVKLSAVLLAVVQLVPIYLTAQTKAPQEQTVSQRQKNTQKLPQKQAGSAPLKRIISGTVVLQANDTTRRPLPNAVVSIVCGDKSIEYTTDSAGRFTLDITSVYKKLRDTFEIEVTHPQHMPTIIEYARRNIKPTENNLIDVVLRDLEITGRKAERLNYETTSVSVFSATYIEPRSKAQKGLSKIKAWWRPITKKKKGH